MVEVSSTEAVPAERIRVRTPSISTEGMGARFGHVPSLDGLRAISVGLVVFAHLVNERFFPGGLGVLIFFVISGFLITRLMIAEAKRDGTVSLPKFYLRRVFRLLPAVLVFSVVVSICFLLIAPTRFDAGEPLSALFYYANYFFAWREMHGPPITMPFGQFWSLSVEEQYYLIFPMLFLWSRAKPKRLLLIATIACVVPLAIRLVYAITWPEVLAPDAHFIYFHTETRIDCIAFGVLVATLCELEIGQRIIAWLTHPLPVAAALATILACLLYRNPFFRETIRYTLLNASVAILICAGVFSRRYRVANFLLNSAPFVWIGQLSYSLYVWHESVAGAVRSVLHGVPLALQTVLAFAIVIAVSSASYYGPEAWARNLRTKLHLR
jgi:peptidoglycan/LPS O-acetylase OafA/YrhL